MLLSATTGTDRRDIHQLTGSEVTSHSAMSQQWNQWLWMTQHLYHHYSQLFIAEHTYDYVRDYTNHLTDDYVHQFTDGKELHESGYIKSPTAESS